MHTYTGRHLKEKILWGNIISSEMGKQNIKANKVYSIASILYRKDVFYSISNPREVKDKKERLLVLRIFCSFCFEVINGGENKYGKD